MKCNNPECSNEVLGRARTCSPKCRKALSRLAVAGNISPLSVTKCDIPGSVTIDIDPSTSEPVSATITQTIVRSRTTGCKVAIPGDEDYVGVCQKIDGKWTIVKPEPIPVKDMTRQQLSIAIRAYPNDQWVNSPEHKELLRRVDTWSIDKLQAEGYKIPARRMVTV